jgi:hypothetical protein
MDDAHVLVRDMAQAVSRRPFTVEARFRSRFSPYGTCGGQSGTGTGFLLSTSVFPCLFHSTDVPLHGKMKGTRPAGSKMIKQIEVNI